MYNKILKNIYIYFKIKKKARITDNTKDDHIVKNIIFN